MQYDIYEAKIVKIANFFKFIFKHKIKIMLCFAFAFIITGTLLGTKGIIVKAGSCPEEIMYGEDLKWKAKAFLADVKYEYREKDSDEWTEEKPVVIGDYYVRAAAKALFGYRYSEEQSFTINPKPITVSVAGSYIYGDDPTIVASTAYEDKIICDSFDFGEIDSQKMKVSEITPLIDSLKAAGKDGKDVTNCYLLIVETKENVTINPRPLHVNVKNESKVWDGVPLRSDKYEFINGTTLADGDDEYFVFNASNSDIGTVRNIPSCVIYDEEKNNVTKFYDIMIDDTSAMLTVTKRPVKVVTASIAPS